jgi:predicted metal-binding membrane protein
MRRRAAPRSRRMRSLSRDQAIVLASIAAITALAWVYLVDMAGDMSDMAEMVGMPDMDSMAGMALVTPYASWAASDVMVAGIMWIVMMAGMMLPSAAPMILLYAAAERRRGAAPLFDTAALVAGYLVVWTGFSLAALGAQWLLLRFGLFAPEMKLTSGLLGGAVFIAAGLYEWSPLKERCLAVCQSPLGFILGHWRPGLDGALRMGVSQGAYCLGCCWVLMLLLFVGGVMNLLWLAGLTILVLAQKIVPGAKRVSRATGLAMVAAGLYLVVQAAR